MTEVWKDIQGYEGIYQVSNAGSVKRLGGPIGGKRKGEFHISERLIKPQKYPNGYTFVGLSNGSVKLRMIHRLVAESFIPNIGGKRCVNHKNGIKYDNRVENLEWVTHSENMVHAIRVIKTHKPPPAIGIKGSDNKRSKRVLCITTGAVYESAGDAARKLNTYQANISRACKGNGGKHRGLWFKYLYQ